MGLQTGPDMDKMAREMGGVKPRLAGLLLLVLVCATPSVAGTTDGPDVIGPLGFKNDRWMPPEGWFGVPGYGACTSVMQNVCQQSCDADATRRGAVSQTAVCRVAWQTGIVRYACSCRGIEPTANPSPNPGIEGCQMCSIGLY